MSVTMAAVAGGAILPVRGETFDLGFRLTPGFFLTVVSFFLAPPILFGFPLCRRLLALCGFGPASRLASSG